MRRMDSDAEEAVRFIPAPPAAAAEGQPEADEKEFISQRMRTVTLINLAGMMERMDEQVRGKEQWKFLKSTVSCSQLLMPNVLCRYCRRSITPLARLLTRHLRSWVT